MKTLATINNARFFVVATDNFLSGWGAAEGRNSVMCAVCDTLADARKVFDRWSDRGDLMSVNIRSTLPRNTEQRVVSYYDGVTLDLID